MMIVIFKLDIVSGSLFTMTMVIEILKLNTILGLLVTVTMVIVNDSNYLKF